MPKYPTSDANVLLDISIDLREKDRRKENRTRMAETVAKKMQKETLEKMFPSSSAGKHNNNEYKYSKQDSLSPAPVTLKIVIAACSEGSRQGRLWCSEFGRGWVKLYVIWSLWKGTEQCTEAKTEIFHDHAVFGFSDLCEPKYGEGAIMRLAIMAAEKIGKAAMNQLETM